MDVIGVGPCPAFDNVQRVAVGIRVFIDPDFFVLEANGIDHQRVSFPMPNLLSEERWVRIVGMLARRIDGYQTKVGVPVKKRDFLCSLQNLKRQTAGVVTWDPADDTKTLRIDGRRQIMLQRCLSGRRQWKFQSRKIFADVPPGYRVTRTFPIPTEVRMTIGGSGSGFGVRWLFIHSRHRVFFPHCTTLKNPNSYP